MIIVLLIMRTTLCKTHVNLGGVMYGFNVQHVCFMYYAGFCCSLLLVE